MESGITFAAWVVRMICSQMKVFANIQVPQLFVAGNLDDISGYTGIQSLYEKTQAPSTYLLTMINAAA